MNEQRIYTIWCDTCECPTEHTTPFKNITVCRECGFPLNLQENPNVKALAELERSIAHTEITLKMLREQAENLREKTALVVTVKTLWRHNIRPGACWRCSRKTTNTYHERHQCFPICPKPTMRGTAAKLPSFVLDILRGALASDDDDFDVINKGKGE